MNAPRPPPTMPYRIFLLIDIGNPFLKVEVAGGKFAVPTQAVNGENNSRRIKKLVPPNL